MAPVQASRLKKKARKKLLRGGGGCGGTAGGRCAVVVLCRLGAAILCPSLLASCCVPPCHAPGPAFHRSARELVAGRSQREESGGADTQSFSDSPRPALPSALCSNPLATPYFFSHNTGASRLSNASREKRGSCWEQPQRAVLLPRGRVRQGGRSAGPWMGALWALERGKARCTPPHPTPPHPTHPTHQRRSSVQAVTSSCHEGAPR